MNVRVCQIRQAAHILASQGCVWLARMWAQATSGSGTCVCACVCVCVCVWVCVCVCVCVCLCLCCFYIGRADQNDIFGTLLQL